MEALCIMKEVIIKRISSWSSCEPVTVCAIDRKKQFPSPLILPIAKGPVKFQSLMASGNEFDFHEEI